MKDREFRNLVCLLKSNILSTNALGNDYLVIAPQDLVFELTPEKIERICHRNFGIGSDGTLLGPLPSNDAKFGLRIFNPDGSEAENSGNGLRIFSRYLWDNQLVREEEFDIDTLGGRVEARVAELGKSVQVEDDRSSHARRANCDRD